jgi:histidinol dehydrogenase
MPAGPSEMLIIADQTASPAFVAADLLAQAEHGPDSQVMLVTNTEDLIEKVLLEIEKQQALLPRIEFIQQSLQNSKIVLMNNLSSCIDFSNAYAPEHLILAIEDPKDFTARVTNAGSVFLGNYSCESAGDYASGTNHTLPTNSYARSYSGVSLDSFLKKITFQELSEEGILNLGPTIECMADAEKLQAHKNAVSVRIKTLQS